MQQHQGKRAKRHAALNAHNTTVARRNRATVSAVRAAPLRKVARYWREPSCRRSAVYGVGYMARLHATLDFNYGGDDSPVDLTSQLPWKSTQ